MNKMTARYLLLILFITVFTVPDIAAQEKKAAIGNSRFKKLMKKENTVVLDVRTAEEFSSGHIPGAINLDVKQEDFRKMVSELDKNKTYLIYCRSGKRSAKALNIMDSIGYPQLLHLRRGIQKWKGDLQTQKN